MSTHLAPYQSQYVAWRLSRRMNADSADEVGLGKTIEAGLVIDELEGRLFRETTTKDIFTIQWELV